MTRMDEAAAEADRATALAIASGPLAPSLRGEVTVDLLRRASAVAAAGVLLLLRGDEAQGAGQIGLDHLPRTDDLARSVRLPLTEPSVVADAVERRESWRRGSSLRDPGNERLLAASRRRAARGGAGRAHGAAGRRGPRVLRRRRRLGAAARKRRRPRVGACSRRGLAMERDLLEERLREFERARGFRP